MHYLSGKNVKQLYKFLVRICQLQNPNQPQKQGLGFFEENHPAIGMGLEGGDKTKFSL